MREVHIAAVDHEGDGVHIWLCSPGSAKWAHYRDPATADTFATIETRWTEHMPLLCLTCAGGELALRAPAGTISGMRPTASDLPWAA